MSKVNFSKVQAEFLKKMTGAESYQEALDTFIELMKLEKADLKKIQAYLDKLMEKNKDKK